MKLEKYKENNYLVDNSGNIIVARLTAKQLKDIQKYLDRIKELSK